MQNPTKNVLAIHDLSCFGRCALTVVIPTLSAMAHQVTPLPTALLSTHTGGFENMEFVDLSGTMKPSFDHMVKSGAKFDAVYSGFLGSAGQIDTVSYIIKENPDALILVDPVMGDDGVLYQTYTDEMKCRMRELCHLATVITPNITEAHFLLGEDKVKHCFDSKNEAVGYAFRLIFGLYSEYNTPNIAITGIEYIENGKKFICTATCTSGQQGFIEKEYAGTGYPGTGDLFSSVLLGKLMGGCSFFESAEIAADFVREVVDDTFAAKTPVRDGVLLEKSLKKLFLA